jgi:hypothetical protein
LFEKDYSAFWVGLQWVGGKWTKMTLGIYNIAVMRFWKWFEGTVYTCRHEEKHKRAGIDGLD